MNRLTKKNEKYNLIVNDKYNPISTTREINNKLGKLEDLEEQIGCPLEVVFKALKEGIWITREVINCSSYCKQNQEIGFMQHKEDRILMLFDFTNREIGFLDMVDRSELWFVCWVKLSDYKKTWWLREDKSE